MHHRRKNQRGAGFLESGLVYGAFFFILIATLDFGYTLFMYQTITERTRLAMRYGIARPYTTDSVAAMKNMILYNSTTPPRDNNGSGMFGIQGSNIAVDRALSGALGVPDRLTVQVSGLRFRMLTPFIAGQKVAKTVVVSAPMETP